MPPRACMFPFLLVAAACGFARAGRTSWAGQIRNHLAHQRSLAGSEEENFVLDPARVPILRVGFRHHFRCTRMASN